MPVDQINNIPALPGIRQHILRDINGLFVRVLEAGYETPGRPGVLLLHGTAERVVRHASCSVFVARRE